MIQDIFPSRFINSYQECEPADESYILYFRKEELLVRHEEEDHKLLFPEKRDFRDMIKTVYLFTIDQKKYFLYFDEKQLADEALPDGFRFRDMRELRGLKLFRNKEIFAVYSAYHLWKWYTSSRFCGACGEKTVHDKTERAMVCPSCGNRIYPRINPAVIVGVINGDKILLTKYRTGFAHNALIAGFTEFGETLEETVQREVMEEVHLKVKNIRYYKSQPWGIALDLLAGFYCEVDGDDTIHLDESELKYGEWVSREDIVLQPTPYSLTNEMMQMFRDGKIKCLQDGTDI